MGVERKWKNDEDVIKLSASIADAVSAVDVDNLVKISGQTRLDMLIFRSCTNFGHYSVNLIERIRRGLGKSVEEFYGKK